MEDKIEVLKINNNLHHQQTSLITFTQMLLISIGCACLVIVLQNSFKKRKLNKLTSNINGPKTYPIIGSAYLFRGSNEDVLWTVMDLIDRYGTGASSNLFKVWLGNYLFIIIYEPRHYEIIFNNPKALAKHDLYKYVKPLVGDGLFSAPVHVWKKNRKLLAPTFNQKILNNFVSTFYEQSAILTDILERHTNKVIDVKELISKFTLDTVAKTGMGIELHEQTGDSHFGKIIDRVTTISFARMFKIWFHPDFIFYNLSIGKEFTKLVNQFNTYMDKVIEEQRIIYKKNKEWSKEHPEAETDECTNLKTFLQLVFELNEDDNVLNDKQLLDEIKTFLIAGSDTTAIVLSFCLVMMGMNKKCQEKVYEEVMDIIGPDRPIEYDDLPKLKYVERFINETNRLFPVGPIVVRDHSGDIDLGDCVIPNGSASVLAILYTHRSAKFWPNPLKFDPDRFLPEEVAKRHPYSYIPFTAGPRICIGKKYAMMVLKVVLSHISRKFKLDTPYKSIEDIRLRQDVLLQPVEGFKIALEARD